MRKLINLTSVCCVLSLAYLPRTSHAGTNLVANTSQGAGASWIQGIWKTNNGTGVGVGTAVVPVAGNTYTYLPNTTAFGNNLGNARTRNPVTNATAVITFDGDSLTMTTNTEIRTKNITTPAALIPILNFPGVGGNPGLILDGGFLNVGDDATIVITGRVQVAGTSFICPGDNGAGPTARPARAFTIAANLSGGGSMVILQTPTNLAQTISGSGNTYSGQWFVKAGRLLGATPGSLGTNSITIDPLLLPPPPMNPGIALTNAWFNGPAVLEVNYTLNSAGTLTLTNGGLMRLHQSTVFRAAFIEGTPLSPGTHYFPELFANFPNNFDPGGSGAITVQPYGTPPSLPPSIIAQPLPQLTYAGKTARFSVTASDNGFPPLTYQWVRGGTNIVDGGNISGATTSILVINNVSAADVGTYQVILGNTSGTQPSSIVSLALQAMSGQAYEAAAVAANPVAFYQLNETGDPAAGIVEAYDFVGGYAGVYGNQVLNGNANYNIVGPRPSDSFPGFGAGNAAAQFANASPGSRITGLPLNLNTNTVTMVAWINPNGPEVGDNGLVYCRAGNTVAGFGYRGSSGMLNYNWNNEQPTWSWDSGIFAPYNQWSLVALVVTPTNATIYVLNTSGLAASSHVYPHVNQGFEGNTVIGDDPFDGGNGSRAFSGIIDDVAVYNQALSQDQIMALYSAAAGTSSFSPSVAIPPASVTAYEGQTVQFTALGVGTGPLTYRWRAGAIGSGIFTNIFDGGQFSGSSSPTLTITGVTMANMLDYSVLVLNGIGAPGSPPAATLTVLATTAAESITMTNQEATGADWDIGAPTQGGNTNWSDANPASFSAVAKPGSTYELLPGARLRSPVNPTVTNFPGNVLTVDGDGVWNVNPGAGATIAEIRFKQPTYGLVQGAVNFPKLRMNGGQLDAGNDNTIIIGGEIDILANTPFNNDGGNDRGYRVDAWLTGGASIEYHGYTQTSFMPNYTNNLNITGTSNTYSGTWNVVTGTLLGTGTNSLGTNHIFVGPSGAVETTYPLLNTNGYLVLSGSGRMYLHTTDVFKSVIVNGTGLAAGSNYSFTTLNTLFPTNFPAAWTKQNGVTNSTGSGSIIVLSGAVPMITVQPRSVTNRGQLTVQLSATAVGGAPLSYQWRAGTAGSGVFTNVSNLANISGATSNLLTITNLSAINAGDYILVVSNASGIATSTVARVTVLSTPFITLQPLSQTNSGTLTAQFYVSAQGDLPLSYQWQVAPIGSGGPYRSLVNGGQISGATGTNLTIVNLALTNSGDYICVISNQYGVATTAVATLTVIDPLMTSDPQSLTRYQGATAQFSVGELGSPTLINQWKAAAAGSGGPYTNLTDGGKFSGTTTRTLTIANVDFPNTADYILVLKNAYGSVTSSVANLTVLASSPAQPYTLDFGGLPIQQPSGADWNTLSSWNPDGEAADTSAPARPGSTYTVVPGARLRSTTNAISIFSGGDFTPGIQLIIAGSGIFTNSPDGTYPSSTPPLIGELRFKHTNPGTNYFRKLVMNGGQLDNGDNGLLIIQGEMDILATTPIYVDSAAAQDRAYQIDSFLTGTGTIEWYQFSSALGGPDLNITGPSNTFSGKWHVVVGTLLGSASNSLGTNSITVETTGALETLYDLHNNAASLVLNGQMFLHQNDTFFNVTVGGKPLGPGTYSFAQLSAAFPANFPGSWTPQTGSTVSTGSGSITVLGAPPGYLSFGFSGGHLQLSWSTGTLLDATNVLGPWRTNNAASPYTVTPSDPAKFYRVQLQ